MVGAERVVNIRAYTEPPATPTWQSTHWVEGKVSSPLAAYPEYQDSRASFGIRTLGSVIVEVETASGRVGVGSAGGAGVPACWIVETLLSRIVEGQPVASVARTWDQMYRATMHFGGGRGLVLHAISAVDLALWDLLGKLRDEPVHQLIGGAVRDELPMYVTGPRPDLAPQHGFIGAKLPLVYSPAEGEDGLRANLDMAARMREAVGDEFWLMVDAWMSLDLEYAKRLGAGLADLGYRWLEEPLPPENYWDHAELRRALSGRILVATGEHDGPLSGFRMLLEMGGCDVIQPDAGWCGGMTEMLRIAALAHAHNKPVIAHGLSPYHAHFSFASVSTPFGECLAPSPEGDELDPSKWTGAPEWLRPVGGKLRLPQGAGFGIDIDTSGLHRPFTH